VTAPAPGSAPTAVERYVLRLARAHVRENRPDLAVEALAWLGGRYALVR
jgi:hypothetical protein